MQNGGQMFNNIMIRSDLYSFLGGVWYHIEKVVILLNA